MNASTVATPQAITLAHNGIAKPFTVISHAKTTRSNCRSAMTEKTTTAIAVKGLIAISSVRRQWVKEGQAPAGRTGLNKAIFVA